MTEYFIPVTRFNYDTQQRANQFLKRVAHMELNTNEVIEIAELEYDVGPVGAVESSDSQINQPAFAQMFLFNFS